MKYRTLFIIITVILLTVSIVFSGIVLAVTPNDPQWTVPDWTWERWG